MLKSLASAMKAKTDEKKKTLKKVYLMTDKIQERILNQLEHKRNNPT